MLRLVREKEYSCGFIFARLYTKRGVPTVCVTCVWAGVDSVWEQRKLEARKLPEIAADSPASSALFVRRFCVVHDSLPKKDNATNVPKILRATSVLAITKKHNLPKLKLIKNQL